VLTPKGCWTSCAHFDFTHCPKFYTKEYDPKNCAYTKDGQYVNHNSACQACKASNSLAVTGGACTSAPIVTPAPIAPSGCKANEVLTPKGCWASCAHFDFSHCPLGYTKDYNPQNCAYTKDGKYVNHNSACQACKASNSLAVTGGACKK
jgi:hypothetical protein